MDVSDYLDSPDLPLNDASVLAPALSPTPPPAGGGSEADPPRCRPLMVTPTGDPHSDTWGAASEGGWPQGRNGFTLRHYEDEIHQLRKDNLSLKLRIYLLEERSGWLGQPGQPPAEERENVYRINIDLRVAHETLKNEVHEKTQLLREAYQALEGFEVERLRERDEFESRIHTLKQTMFESQFSQLDQPQGPSCASRNDPETSLGVEATERPSPEPVLSVGEKSHLLLREAFGDQLNGSGPSLAQEMENRVKHLEMDLETQDLERDRLTAELDEAQSARQALEAELRERILSMTAVETRTQDLDRQVHRQKAAMQALQERIQELEAAPAPSPDFNVEAVLHQVQELEERLRGHEQQLQGLDRELEVASRERDEARAELQTQVQAMVELQETISKSQICLQGFADANVSQLKENEKLEKEIQKRDKALQILTEQYEILKTKVRKYRANASNHSGFSQESSPKEDTEPMQAMAQALAAAQGREELLQAEINRLEAHLSPDSHWHEREIQALKSELKRFKQRALKDTTQKLDIRYREAIDGYSKGVHTVMEAMRTRLEELVDFLQRLIALDRDGSWDVSGMSTSMRDALRQSMDEGRRLSQSLSLSLMVPQEDDFNETQRSVLLEMPQFAWPRLSDIEDTTFEADEMEPKVDEYRALIEELKDNVRERVKAQDELKDLREKMAEDTWSQPDQAESRRRMALPTAMRGSNRAPSEAESDSSDMSLNQFRKTKAKVIQLKARLTSQEERFNQEHTEIQGQLAKSNDIIASLKEEKKTLTWQLTSIKEELDENISTVMAELTQVSRSNQKMTRKVQELAQSLESANQTIQNHQKSQKAREIFEENMNNAHMEAEMKYEAEIQTLQLCVVKLTSEVEALSELKTKSTHQECQIQDLIQMKGRLLRDLESAKTSCPKAVFVSRDNFEEQELALGQSHGRRSSLLDAEGCDCSARIKELEKLLTRTKELLDEANAEINREKARKEKMEKSVRKQVMKTKKVLQKTKENQQPIQE